MSMTKARTAKAGIGKAPARRAAPGKPGVAKARPGKAGAGSSFDAFLSEEGLLDHAHAIAVKRVIAWQIAQEMEKQSITKIEMAARMQTSRSQLDRLLDPANDQVLLETLERAARAVGRTLRLELD